MIKPAFDLGSFAALLGGGVVGAAVGWIVAEILIYQFLEKPCEELYSADVEFGGKDLDEVESEPIKVVTKWAKEGDPVKLNYAEKFKDGKLKSKVVEADHDSWVADPDAEDIEDDDEEGREAYEGYAESEGLTVEEMESMITEEEYDEENPEDQGLIGVVMEEGPWIIHPYHQENLNYYEDDHVLSDTGDNVIHNPETVVGRLALHMFGHGTTDPDTVFVRNDDEMIKYEISRIHGSYEEDVLGLPAPVVKPGRKRHKPKVVKDDEAQAARRKRHAKMKSELDDENNKNDTT